MEQKNATNIRRSFKRRRLEGLLCIGVAVIFVMLQSVTTTESVPMNSGFIRLHKLAGGRLHSWHHRVTRDAANNAGMLSTAQLQQHDNARDLLMLGSSTEITLDQQPQGQCLLDGEYVPETTAFCEKHVGCRAIQKTGHCCPDYKCDCQKDGKTYLNGDKLVDPETPCTVCYCQGGEILCSSVTCFHRDDCTPKYIPGVCCPEYDNCPVGTSESSQNQTSATISNTLAPELPPASENNPKITIKEITKPTEIRITDDNRAIPIHQMLKPTTTTTTSPTSSTSTTTPTTIASSTMPPPLVPTIAVTTNPINSSNTQTVTTAHAIKEVDLHGKLNEESLHTLSADKNPDRSDNKIGISSGDILKLTASVAYTPTAASTSGPLVESSVEVEDPVPALTAFSTQGLPEDPSKVNIKREYFVTTEGVQAVTQHYDGLDSSEYPSSELIYSCGPSSAGQQTHNGFQQSSAELDSDTAGSDNIYHIILTTDGPRVAPTSENYLALKGSSSTEGSPFEDLSSSALDNDIAHSFPSTTEGPEVSSTTTIKNEYYVKSSTESISQQHLDDLDDSEIPMESNPAYPSLPGDDFSIRGDNNFQLSDNDEVGEEPRSIGSGAGRSSNDSFKSTKHLEDANYGSKSGSESGSGGYSGSGMMVEELMDFPAPVEGSGGMDLSTKSANYDMKVKTPEFIQFMYSAEDSSEETKITNSTDFQMGNEKKSEDPSFESTELLTPLGTLIVAEDGSGSGSGAGEIKPKKEREPTTPRPHRGSATTDIDDIHDGSSGNGPSEDPKDDAESLKLDESAADLMGNPEKSANVKVPTAFYNPSV